MSAACFGSLCATLFVVYLLWTDPIAAGHDTRSLIVMGTVFGIATALYFIAKAVRRRRGIDIEAAFREIPVE
jgi:hypothetical protein